MMTVWRCVLGLFLMSCLPVQALPQWAAMPAFDPLHLDGPHANRKVCPMCAHGYDAGLLVFVPATTAPATAARIAVTLRAAAVSIEDARFRVFLIVTGATPTAALRSALRQDAPKWHVAELRGADLAAAERDYRVRLVDQVRGYAFAQRRMLRTLDAAALHDATAMREASADAMSLLMLAQNGRDDRQGLLWMAASTLPSVLRNGDGRVHRVCLADAAGRGLADALVLLRPAPGQRAGAGHSAKADDAGCVGLQGDAPATIAAFTPDGATAVIRVDPVQASSDQPLRIRSGRETIVGRPCEGCETAFVDQPRVIRTAGRIAPDTAQGVPMRIDGRVFDRDGQPAPGIVIYAYQTDADGHYPGQDAAHPHGQRRGWARSDHQGHYRFDTIRPGAYPGRDTPQHVHLHVIEPGRCSYYIDDLSFSDDPRNRAPTPAERAAARGGSGYAVPIRDARGRWLVTRDIVLGRHIPGDAACTAL